MDFTQIENNFTTCQIRAILNDKTLFNSKNEFSLKDAQKEYCYLTHMPTDTVDSKLKEALLKLTTCGNYEAFSGGTDKNITKHELGHAIRTLKFEKKDDGDTDNDGNNPNYDNDHNGYYGDFDFPRFQNSPRFCPPNWFWQSMMQFMMRCNPQSQYMPAS